MVPCPWRPGTQSSRSRQPQFEALLPLIAAYQRFYEVDDIDDERNRAFFRRFLAPSDDGMLLGAWDADELVGYACLYWNFTSLVPAETVLMNDLYVEEKARGRGVGRALSKQAPRSLANVAPTTSSGPPPPTTSPPSASTTPPAPSARPGSSTSCRSKRQL